MNNHRLELQKTIQSLNLNLSLVSAIIERQHEGETEILVQTRWKPESDPVYSGTLEIPAGAMNRYENVYDAIAREVLEETGLKITGFKPDVRTGVHSSNGDECFAFVPFCCQQQLKGEWPRVGFVFLCTVEDKQPVPGPGEVKNIRWMKKAELRKILQETPEKIFILQAGVLEYYLDFEWTPALSYAQPNPNGGAGSPGEDAQTGAGRTQINQGDIYWVQLDEPSESEPGYAHPYVVIQDDIINRSRINTVVVCALTSNIKQQRRR